MAKKDKFHDEVKNALIKLAMPTEAYDEILDEKDGQAFIVEEKLRLVLYDPVNEVLDRWIE